MNPDTIFQSIQKGFRTTVGAAYFLVDLAQYPDQRDENLVRLRTDLERLTEEWATQGEAKEQEARLFVERMFNQPSASGSATTGTTTDPTNPTPVAPPEVQEDLKDLTAQIAALRAELEKLREQGS